MLEYKIKLAMFYFMSYNRGMKKKKYTTAEELSTPQLGNIVCIDEPGELDEFIAGTDYMEYLRSAINYSSPTAAEQLNKFIQSINHFGHCASCPQKNCPQGPISNDPIVNQQLKDLKERALDLATCLLPGDYKTTAGDVSVLDNSIFLRLNNSWTFTAILNNYHPDDIEEAMLSFSFGFFKGTEDVIPIPMAIDMANEMLSELESVIKQKG